MPRSAGVAVMAKVECSPHIGDDALLIPVDRARVAYYRTITIYRYERAFYHRQFKSTTMFRFSPSSSCYLMYIREWEENMSRPQIQIQSVKVQKEKGNPTTATEKYGVTTSKYIDKHHILYPLKDLKKLLQTSLTFLPWSRLQEFDSKVIFMLCFFHLWFYLFSLYTFFGSMNFIWKNCT